MHACYLFSIHLIASVSVSATAIPQPQLSDPELSASNPPNLNLQNNIDEFSIDNSAVAT